MLAITFLTVGLSACDQLLEILSEENMPQIEGKVPQLEGFSGDIPIGVVLPLTGRHVSSFGEPMGRGFELALEEINNAQHGDARIRLIVEDDLSTAEGAVEAFNKLIIEVTYPSSSGLRPQVRPKRRSPWRETIKLRQLAQHPPTVDSVQLAIMFFALLSLRMSLFLTVLR